MIQYCKFWINYILQILINYFWLLRLLLANKVHLDHVYHQWQDIISISASMQSHFWYSELIRKICSILPSDMFLLTLQNVTFWRATRCNLPKTAQKIQEKAKNHQYLTKNVHVWYCCHLVALKSGFSQSYQICTFCTKKWWFLAFPQIFCQISTNHIW